MKRMPEIAVDDIIFQLAESRFVEMGQAGCASDECEQRRDGRRKQSFFQPDQEDQCSLQSRIGYRQLV